MDLRSVGTHHKATRRQNSEDQDLRLHRSENLKSHLLIIPWLNMEEVMAGICRTHGAAEKCIQNHSRKI